MLASLYLELNITTIYKYSTYFSTTHINQNDGVVVYVEII